MSDYKQTRDAAGKVTAQYDKMLRSLGDDDLVRVTVSDGKYTFIQKEDGSCIALRYGEPWRDDIFDGLMLGMAYRIEELEAKLAKALGAMAINPWSIGHSEWKRHVNDTMAELEQKQ
jgi:hypothetical protein